MSKYDKLWEFIKNNGEKQTTLTFDEIKQILGFSIDHSFLNSKKELLEYGYKVEKISLKEKKVSIIKVNDIQKEYNL